MSALTPVLFQDRSRQGQIVLAGVLPALLGIVAGVLLGVASGAYWAVAAVAAIGAFLAGLEHLGARSGAVRGLISGAVYGIALLLAHAVAGTHAKTSLGSFPPLLIVITAIIGMVLTAAGHLVRPRENPRGRPAQ